MSDNSKLSYVDNDLNASRLVSLIKSNIELTEKLINCDRIKTDFFANISHELKTPINIILSSTQLVELFLSKPELIREEIVRKHVLTVKQNSLRLIRLINNLVDLNKAEQGFYKLNLFHTDINSLVRNIALSSEEYFKSRSQTLHVDIPEEHCNIICDPEKVERILLNLLSNAAKYTPDNGIISISVKNIKSRCTIAVSDNGPGIPKENLKSIFDKFNQVNNGKSSIDKGNGIGLSLSKLLAELHSGTISVKSTPGTGSTFTLELPLTQKKAIKVPVHKPADNKNDYKSRLNMEFSSLY